MRGIHPGIERFHPIPHVLKYQRPIAFEVLEDPWDRNLVFTLGRRNAGRGPEQRQGSVFDDLDTELAF